MSPKPIFREYIIGSKDVPPIEGFPVEIIDKRIPQFHFILAFASDDYVEDASGKKQGKGNFRANWNVTKFSAKSVRELKAEYEGVKVVISLGGRGTNFPFNPKDKEIWIDNAKKSLNEIISVLYKFHHETVIDGIDINYEHIESSEDDFAYSIGKVIDYLQTTISGLVVSIAPSKPVLPHYQQLFKANPNRIHWVNYQYYDQKVPSTQEFVNLHKTLIDTFGVDKLLAGFSTDPNDKSNISPEVFVEGALQLMHLVRLLEFLFQMLSPPAWMSLPSTLRKRHKRSLLDPVRSSHHDTITLCSLLSLYYI